MSSVLPLRGPMTYLDARAVPRCPGRYRASHELCERRCRCSSGVTAARVVGGLVCWERVCPPHMRGSRGQDLCTAPLGVGGSTPALVTDRRRAVGSSLN